MIYLWFLPSIGPGVIATLSGLVVLYSLGRGLATDASETLAGRALAGMLSATVATVALIAK
ncbi:hypothetical protein [Amycolatopsis sp. DG1A-15b]|uniref:hypothetical protein n=1 Tax=Amycolatopsis sp. DG1A-15b TaxID=3052846 RepID=UPI00255BA024|nr:hypothetical protein [Amycolatopsis sp. DG1A-15b]WIX84648.1 hypothetical protein QRY02_25700 [Amycolatopsis sp. DG1A-15b]